uniref:Serine/threonine-protein kinase DDB_G0282963 n=1 Tax=Parastrongyloides trichosuri TaxID=131310 RepID=A0A0N4ZQZ2_PARTI
MFCFCRFLFKGCFNTDDGEEDYNNNEQGQRRNINENFNNDRFFWRHQNPFNIGGRIGPRVSHLRTNLYPTPDLLPPKYEDAIKIPSLEPPPVYCENGTNDITLQPPSYESSIISSLTSHVTSNTGVNNINNTGRSQLRIPQVSVTHTSSPFPSQFQIIYNNNNSNDNGISNNISNNSERVRSNSTPGTYNTGGAVMYLQYTENDEELPGSVNNDLERNKDGTTTRGILSNLQRLTPKLVRQKSNSTDGINNTINDNNTTNWKTQLPNSARYNRNSTNNNNDNSIQVLTVCALH